LLPALYCLVLIFLGAFFLLNLMLAVVMESYIKGEIEENKKLDDQIKLEQVKLEERVK
jgi:hypothetical protein